MLFLILKKFVKIHYSDSFQICLDKEERESVSMKKILLVLTILLVFVISCGKSNDSETLKLNLKEEGKSYDPQLANDSTGEFVDSLVVETLTRQAEDGKSLPGIAEKWEHNENSTVWTFHLRKNAKWSNGDPITAKDFKDGWVRALNPKTAGEYADKLFYIKNAKEFNAGEIKDENQLGIKVIDDYTLEVTLNNPLTYFDSIVRIQTYAPLNKKFYDTVGEKYMTSPETSISSGVYTIKSWTRDSEIVFEKNENYWNKDNIKLKFVKVLFINDASASVNAFKNREIDSTNISIEQAKEFKNDKRKLLTKDGSVWYMTYNMKNKVLANKKIRQALSLAVDREKLITDILDNTGEAAYTYTTKGVGIIGVSKDFSEEAGKIFPAYNPQKAKQLLAEGLKELGLQKLPELTMIFNDSGNNKVISEYIQESLRTNLGVNLKIEGMALNSRLDKMQRKDYEIALAGYNGDYNDAITYLDRFLTKTGNNYSDYSNPRYDELVKKVNSSGNQAERVKDMIEMEKIIAEDMPVGLLYYREQTKLLNPRVHNIVFSPIGKDFVLDNTYIK